MASGALFSCSLSASILEKSRISSISEQQRCEPNARWPWRRSAAPGQLGVAQQRRHPEDPFIGVRISWLTAARKRDLARLAASAALARLAQLGLGMAAFRDVASETTAPPAPRPRWPGPHAPLHSNQRGPAMLDLHPRMALLTQRGAASGLVASPASTLGANARPRISTAPARRSRTPGSRSQPALGVAAQDHVGLVVQQVAVAEPRSRGFPTGCP